jgi:hypothetical protein
MQWPSEIFETAVRVGMSATLCRTGQVLGAIDLAPRELQCFSACKSRVLGATSSREQA